MKISGIIRRIDALGRIVIPKEIRKDSHIKEGDQLEISSSSDDTIILKKYNQLDMNKEFINLFIKSIQSVLNCDINIVDEGNIIYSTDNTQLNNKYIIKANSKTYDISPNGDKLCSIVFIFHGKSYDEKPLFTEELAKILMVFLEE